MIENGVKFLHTSADVWSGDRLARRRSLVQTPLKEQKFLRFKAIYSLKNIFIIDSDRWSMVRLGLNFLVSFRGEGIPKNTIYMYKFCGMPFQYVILNCCSSNYLLVFYHLTAEDGLVSN